MDAHTTGLVFREYGIAEVLTQFVLKVPLNQRSYAWTEDEVQTLLDDLYRAFSDGDEIYFLGTIVLTPGQETLEVADGQQRLATVSTMLAAARDLLMELGDDDGANKYQSSFLLNYNERRKDSTPKLYLNYEDHEFFVKTILCPPAKRSEFKGAPFSSHGRLAKSAELASTHLRKPSRSGSRVGKG